MGGGGGNRYPQMRSQRNANYAPYHDKYQHQHQHQVVAEQRLGRTGKTYPHDGEAKSVPPALQPGRYYARMSSPDSDPSNDGLKQPSSSRSRSGGRFGTQELP